ncbi:MAG: gamma-glutamylputrescine oxidase [Actinomycetota bacterium]
MWEDGRAPVLPRLEEPFEADVCVIGLGGSGLSAILRLLEHGRSVIGLDARTVGGGAAGRNGGFFLAGAPAFHHHARSAPLYRATLAELERMEAETPGIIRRTGSLRVALSPEEEADCAAQLAAMRSDDLPVEPYVGPEGSGLLFPADGAGNPLARCRALARTALAGGARLFGESPAVAIEAGRVVVGGSGAIVECDRVVVAVDGGLERLLPELAGRVRTTRLQMLATAPAPEVHIPRPVYARWGFDYWQQLPDGRVAAGGLRDRFGDAEWEQPDEPTDDVQRALEAMVRERTGVRAPVTHRWAGTVSFTIGEDAAHVPIAEEVRPGVFAIGAYSGTGNVLGALYGRAAADWTVTGILSPPW